MFIKFNKTKNPANFLYIAGFFILFMLYILKSDFKNVYYLPNLFYIDVF